MTTDLVISAYAADLGWLERLRNNCPDVRIFIYDKDQGQRVTPPPMPSDRLIYERLPNVGMCDHSYMHHLVEHHDDLSDWTVFSVDSPFDHMAGVSFEKMFVPSTYIRVPWLCTVRDWGSDGRISWNRIVHRGRDGKRWCDKYADGTITPCQKSFADWARLFLGLDVNKRWRGYHPGGVFGASRDMLHWLGLGTCAVIRNELSCSVQPEEGHYMERLWVEALNP